MLQGFLLIGVGGASAGLGLTSYVIDAFTLYAASGKPV